MPIDHPDENWRDIPGHPGYQVSDLGRIGSFLSRQGRIGTVRKFRKLHISRDGYLVVDLWSHGTRKVIPVYRLVLLAFVGPCPPGMEACHNNGVRMDNRLTNLRWDTPKNNHADRIRHGHVVRFPGETNVHVKLTTDQVMAIRHLASEGISQSILGAQFGVHQVTVSKIVRRQRWQHI